MVSIGVRELRQQASKYLQAVERGETVEVTDRGRPVALLVPVPTERPMARLEAQGRLSTAEGDVLDLGPPLASAASAPLPSDELEEARREER